MAKNIDHGQWTKNKSIGNGVVYKPEGNEELSWLYFYVHYLNVNKIKKQTKNTTKLTKKQ